MLNQLLLLAMLVVCAVAAGAGFAVGYVAGKDRGIALARRAPEVYVPLELRTPRPKEMK